MRTRNPFPTDDYEFGLCLTHDVDRPYKGAQSLFYAASERDLSHLRAMVPGVNPWWQFDKIKELESSLGVRSAFYFLNDQHVLRDRPIPEWFRPRHWIEHLGRYDPTEPEMAAVVRDLDRDGWEVGLHGSLGTHRDRQRLAYEKALLESVLGHDVMGGRQHHLKLSIPGTWLRHVDVGLSYDASLGSTDSVGFDYGYDLLQPFDDSFVVFPLTVMDKTLMTVSDDQATARDRLSDLIDTAKEHNAVMTALWHPRNFSEVDYPGQRELYRTLIEEAIENGGWVGPPRDLYEKLQSSERQPLKV
jgi:peptidoglycan/xylan/chitin deacetylase (PgdA/CDA1 family)